MGEKQDIVYHNSLDEPTREQAARVLRDVLFPNGYLIPDTPHGIDEVTVWQMQASGVSIADIAEVFRYHATVHDETNASVYECHVVGRDPGHAREVLYAFLRTNQMEDFSRLPIVLMNVRCDIQSPLPLIK
ncbi:hypothetical protein RY831_26915 [Noviherbaspirillum sp. CPCC 100848]|uniref:Uncharacterized protein n=1 Tax=Noviherbaspirillum album TaxID=3080276 RepID=A0ABU6JH46_9BURK|nr:hypothetical protein [Noviherbaspirillum sp. CPCC 100848]MEC4722796.1 hypothetical protein [Noviherbaspirillum sp. CPCC 100848]